MAQKCTYLLDENQKNSYFLHKSGLQWPVMNKWKRLIYFQTKSDFLDTFLLLGSLWSGQFNNLDSIYSISCQLNWYEHLCKTNTCWTTALQISTMEYCSHLSRLTKFQLIQLIQIICISIFSTCCLIEWGFTKFFFKKMLKVSALYLEKQKSFISKKIWFRL